MPDLFDGFFNKINTRINGKSTPHYGGATQVNTGKFYSYTNSASNNHYWMSKSETSMQTGETEVIPIKQRTMSVNSITSEKEDGPRSRFSSVSSESGSGQ
ncbi:uncharacterized protein RJT20DRAFT_1918 [Scheffersomyces xylosifermentans]|uniref:uncharacterized protein n=1 Tax=Scheffersomyces xylosifermentans TaxID=1304137 RepID=UPI00315DD855